MNMKTRIFTMLAALLLSVGAFAQSGNVESKRGDLNNDGKVDAADVVTLVNIIINGGEEVDNSAYFFYVGLEMPTSASNPAANLVSAGQPGWHLIGNSLNDINSANPALDGSDQANNIVVEPTYTTPDGLDFYIVIPQELNIYDGLGKNLNGNYTAMGTVEIGGHTYKVFKAHDYEFIFNIYGEVDNSAYFFYVGLEKPTSDSNPAATYVHANWVPGWHLIGNSIDGYNSTNPIYVGGDANQTINLNENYDDIDFYVAIPVGTHLYDGFGTYLDNDFIDTENVKIGENTYNIFKIHNSDFLFSIY